MKIIIRKGALGDVLWVQPLIAHYLSLGEKVIMVTDFTDLFQNYPDKNFKVVKKLSFFWDVLRRIEKRINLHHFINLNGYYEKYPKQHVLYSYFQAASAKLERLSYPNLFLSEKEKSFLGKEKYVVIHLESQRNLNYRNIHGIEWDKVVEVIHAQGYKVFEIGSDKASAKTAYWHQTSSLRDLIVLINHSSYFIGIDSGPSHIAAALKIPAILFFGSVNPAYRHFLELFKGIILQGECEFAGCYHETIGYFGSVCRIVGDSGIPPCTIFSTESVKKAFIKLEKEYPNPQL